VRITGVSQDGRKWINRRITFRLCGGDFANVLCLVYREHDLEEDGPLPDLSKAKILELVDDVLLERADKRNWWSDDVDDDDFRDALWEWADELIRRRFPEFY
jgi:hypothetical protein